MKSLITTSILLIVIVACFCFIANTTISFSPFKITMKTPLTAIGFFMIWIGIALVIFEKSRIARHEGALEGMQMLSDSLKKEMSERNLLYDSLKPKNQPNE